MTFTDVTAWPVLLAPVAALMPSLPLVAAVALAIVTFAPLLVVTVNVVGVISNAKCVAERSVVSTT